MIVQLAVSPSVLAPMLSLFTYSLFTQHPPFLQSTFCSLALLYLKLHVTSAMIEHPELLLAGLRSSTSNRPEDVLLDFIPYNVTNCQLPASAAIALLFVQTACALRLQSSWTDASPPMLWRALDSIALPAKPSVHVRPLRGLDMTSTTTPPSSLQPRTALSLPFTPLFAVGSPSQSRIALLSRLMATLALENGVLISDDALACTPTQWPGPHVCVHGTLEAIHLDQMREARTPVLVFDL